jgi:hypothetical protein
VNAAGSAAGFAAAAPVAPCPAVAKKQLIAATQTTAVHPVVLVSPTLSI